jgi:cytochrome c-type biogenesis protein CcmH/NrfG
MRLQGKFKEAASLFQEALAIEPHDQFALRGYAEALKHQN